jgi:hypothetical protein
MKKPARSDPNTSHLASGYFVAADLAALQAANTTKPFPLETATRATTSAFASSGDASVVSIVRTGARGEVVRNRG